MKALFCAIVFGSALTFTPSCVNPPTIDAEGNPIGAGASLSLRQRGAEEFLKFKKQKKIVTDRRYTAQVQRVAARLTRVIPLPNAKWEFVVFEDKTPNAFALPGGKVGIHTGLFQITKNDAGLATVLAHEIAHVSADHAGHRVKQQTGLAIGGVLLDQVLKRNDASKTTRGATAGLYGAGAALGVALPFSRRQELEADRVGMIYMAKAGYDPLEAVNLWKRFADYNARQGKSKTPEFLRTHPLDTTRIKALQTSLPQADKYYQR